MKKRYTLIALPVVAMFALAGCSSGGGGGSASTSGGSTDSTSSGAASADAPSVVEVIPGALGDKGFFDDSARGMDQIKSDGSTTKIVEGDLNNPNQWKDNLVSVSDGSWDVVITGTTQMHDPLDEVAPDYTDQKYIIYDDNVEQPNVASIQYKQNEGSYLAGVLAGLITTDKTTFPLATGSKKIGLVGGMDIPVINDFLVGYEKGAQTVDPSIQIVKSYVGDFADSNKGYEQAKAMFDQGADVVFAVAGGAGLGVLKAATDANKYAIGVDQDQSQLQPGHIPASMLKNIGASLVNAVNEYKAGTLKFGEVTSYGLSNDGVSLVFDDSLVPASVQDEINTYAQKVIDGEIEVPSTLS